MKNNPQTLKILFILIAATLINACGGAVGTSVAEGGISGTGITMGRITNFGSIFVNGVRFDVDNASFQRDGKPSNGQDDFSIGEYVVIKGSVDDKGTSGIASEVIFEDVLDGAVTEVSTNNVTIEILGQLIKTDNITALHGIDNLSDLSSGNIVEVSGIKDAEGLITATSIKLKQETFVVGVSENELKGIISNIDLSAKTLIINNILVDYSAVELQGFNGQNPQIGQFVEIKSDLEIIGNTLLASKMELKSESQEIASNTKLEVEGVVTRFFSLLDFDVNGITVSTDTNTEYKNGVAADLTLNSEIEVEGKVNNAGVLIAEEIKFEKQENESSSEDDEENENSESEANNSNNEDNSDEPESDDNESGSDDSNSESDNNESAPEDSESEPVENENESDENETEDDGNETEENESESEEDQSVEDSEDPEDD